MTRKDIIFMLMDHEMLIFKCWYVQKVLSVKFSIVYNVRKPANPSQKKNLDPTYSPKVSQLLNLYH